MSHNFIKDVNTDLRNDCTVRQQAITWINVDSDLCCYMASLGHNELIIKNWVGQGKDPSL